MVVQCPNPSVLNGVIAPFIEMGSKEHFTCQDTLNCRVPDFSVDNERAIEDCSNGISDSTDLHKMVFQNNLLICCHVDDLNQTNRINMMLI